MSFFLYLFYKKYNKSLFWYFIICCFSWLYLVFILIYMYKYKRILVQLLQKLPKIRVLVISHLDSEHAQNLIDTLSHYGNNLYLFDSWEKSSISSSIFNQIPHDIVITTFPVSNCPKPIICSRNLSTVELFHHLHLLGSQIHKERLA